MLYRMSLYPKGCPYYNIGYPYSNMYVYHTAIGPEYGHPSYLLNKSIK